MSYLDRARTRAKRRKSPWNILLIVVCFSSWLTLAFALIWGNGVIHQHLYPGDPLLAHAKGFVVLLATLPLLIGSVPVGFIAGNFFVWLVPPIRRVLNNEAKPFPETSFIASQRGLLKFATYVTPPSIAIAVVGGLLPW